ncbi:MAG: hypothetical protein ACI9U2_004512 [Bradymonadia bacterium]
MVASDAAVDGDAVGSDAPTSLISSDAAVSAVVDAARKLGDAFLDPWVVFDANDTVIAFDARFRRLFARHQARRLEGSQCCAFLTFDVCGDGTHLSSRCRAEGRTLRFEEIEAHLDGEDTARRFTLAATPLGDGAALVAVRDVTDVATMQQKYRALSAQKAQSSESIQIDLTRKTKELLDTQMQLNRVQHELVQFKKGLFG